MFGIKKLLFGDGPNENLPEDVRAAVAAWQDGEAGGLESSHFLTRYVIVDVTTDGRDPETDRVTGIAATVLHKGMVAPEQSIFVDLTASTADDAATARQLAALLLFIGKSPLVTYNVVHASAFLQALMKKSLGIGFSARWVDLVWLLPAMFSERSHKPMPLDEWLVAFDIDAGEGRRDPVRNCLVLARLMQMLVVRAHRKGVDSVEALIVESKASSQLRRTH